MITDTSIDLAGKIRIMWQQPSGVTYVFKFNSQPSLQELENLANQKEQFEEYINVESLDLSIKNKDLILILVELIKEKPTITSAQFNTFISNFSWQDQVKIRTLIYDIATKLAERKGIVLTATNEAHYLQKVRDFIAITPIRKLARLFLNQFDF